MTTTEAKTLTISSIVRRNSDRMIGIIESIGYKTGMVIITWDDKTQSYLAPYEMQRISIERIK